MKCLAFFVYEKKKKNPLMLSMLGKKKNKTKKKTSDDILKYISYFFSINRICYIMQMLNPILRKK